jgi:hypothetical protein
MMNSINALIDTDNISGLESTILIIPSLAIKAVGDTLITDYHVLKAFDFTSGDFGISKWLALQHTLDTGILKEEAEDKEYGTQFNYQIECFVPKMYLSRPFQFNELSQYQYIVICKDQNGYSRVVGVSESGPNSRGCSLEWKYSTGKVSKDRNGYLLSFTFSTSKKAPLIKDPHLLPVESTYYSI